MVKRFIYLILSILFLFYPQLSLSVEKCDNITDITERNEINSYKALGKIEFFKYCKITELCESGAYIIKGDYFIAVQQHNYLCAAYFSNDKNHSKTIGIITGKNVLKTGVDEYNFLIGSWNNHFYNINKYIEFYLSETELKFYGESETKIGEYRNYFDGTILKVGKSNFIGITGDGLYYIAVDKDRLLIKNEEFTTEIHKDYDFFGEFLRINK